MASSAATSSAGSAARRAVLTFVTGNKKKLEEFVALVPKGFAFDVTNHKIDLPELQGEPEEISAEKCRLAAKEVSVLFTTNRSPSRRAVRVFTTVLALYMCEGRHRLVAQ